MVGHLAEMALTVQTQPNTPASTEGVVSVSAQPRLPLPDSYRYTKTLYHADKYTLKSAPDLILLSIFKMIADEHRPDLSSVVPYLDCTVERENTNWFSFMRVCRRWYYEAKNYSVLWSYINIGSYDVGRLETYLERSRQAPLDVELYSTSENSKKIIDRIQSLLPHAYRIENILVKLLCSSSTSFFLPLMENARELRSLTILSFPRRPIMKGCLGSGTMSSLQNLRKLQLCCVFPEPELRPCFANVIELCLQWSNLEKCPTWTEFASFMNLFPMLDYLEIVDFEFEGQSEARVQSGGAEKHIVRMPQLKRLRTSLSVQSSIFLLNRMDLSATAQLNIICEEYHLEDPIVVPAHLSERTPRVGLRVTPTEKSIWFSAIFLVDDRKEQDIQIGLCLRNKRMEVLDGWKTGLMCRWLNSAPFNGGNYVPNSSKGLNN